MQKVIVLGYDDEELSKAIDIIAQHIESMSHDIMKSLLLDMGDIKIQTFDTPLEAFAAQEGPYRIEQLIENGCMRRPENENLLSAIGNIAAHNIENNLMGYSSDYPSILDNDTLEQIAIDSALNVFKEYAKDLKLSDRDRKFVAEQFIKDYGNND